MSFYPRILNGPTRFSWLEKDGKNLSFTTINRKNDARNEFNLSLHWRLIDLKVYESGSDGAGSEWRLSFALLWLSINIHLCYAPKSKFREWEDSNSWGWYFMDRRSFNLCYGRKRWVFDLPFVTTVFHRHEILSPNREVAWTRPNTKGRWSEIMDKEREAKKPHIRTFPFRYVRKNGDVQERTVSVIFERTYRRYKWTPFCAVETYMEYEFNREVGEGVDEWKGGVIASAIKAQPRETLEQCVKRLETTRKF